MTAQGAGGARGSGKQSEYSHREKLKQIEQGVVGSVIGSGQNAVTNVIGIVLLIVVLALVSPLFFTSSLATQNPNLFDTIITGLLSVLTLLVGYLCGVYTSK